MWVGPLFTATVGCRFRYFGLSEPAHYWNTVLEMNDYVRNRDRIRSIGRECRFARCAPIRPPRAQRLVLRSLLKFPLMARFIPLV